MFVHYCSLECHVESIKCIEPYFSIRMGYVIGSIFEKIHRMAPFDGLPYLASLLVLNINTYKLFQVEVKDVGIDGALILKKTMSWMFEFL